MERPVQFTSRASASKDNAGKEIIREVVHFAKQNVRRRIVFLEDYDTDVARYLVQGVDVAEQSAAADGGQRTSGMKAAMNGVLNMSILDGWWVEGYTPEGGWIIGAGEEYDDTEYQDKVESQAIFNLLENEVVPLFYSQSRDRLPRRWIHRMKNTIKWCAPRFNTSRMVAEYTRKFYNPAAARWRYLTAEAMARVRALSTWKSNLRNTWDDLAIQKVDVEVAEDARLRTLTR